MQFYTGSSRHDSVRASYDKPVDMTVWELHMINQSTWQCESFIWKTSRHDSVRASYDQPVDMTVWELHTINQSTWQCASFIWSTSRHDSVRASHDKPKTWSFHLEEYLQMKVKGLSNQDGPRSPHILLNIVFPIGIFYGVFLSGNLWS